MKTFNAPAICINPSCNTIFPSGFGFGGTSQYIGCISGPCPRCGGNGKIPDGLYKIINDNIYAEIKNVADLNLINRALELIRSDICSNKSHKEIKRNITEKVPELACLWDLIPRTRMEAYTIIGIIMATLTAFLAPSSCSKSNEEHKSEVFNQAVQNVYHYENVTHIYSQPDTHTKQTK
ncbi:MAG: hypothetical protein ACI8ZB_005370 [Desulforhopalus sp.]|jgi:hypothetical protein